MTPPKFQFSKNILPQKLLLFQWLKKCPYCFWILKSKVLKYDQFYVCTSEAPKQWEETISKKRRSFNWFSCNSELEATWISLIGWPNKTSIIEAILIRNACTLLVWYKCLRPPLFQDSKKTITSAEINDI